jgi:hypothetical protein
VPLSIAPTAPKTTWAVRVRTMGETLLPKKSYASILADAMTPDELPSPPRKRRWKRLMVASACVVAVTIIALLTKSQKKGVVTVRFVRSTNELGVKKFVFEGTNGIPRPITYYAGVSTNMISNSKTLAGLGPFPSLTMGDASATGTFLFCLEPPQDGVEWRVIWFFTDQAKSQSPWERLNEGCSALFRTIGMPKLARRFRRGPEVHYIPSTEIKE